MTVLRTGVVATVDVVFSDREEDLALERRVRLLCRSFGVADVRFEVLTLSLAGYALSLSTVFAARLVNDVARNLVVYLIRGRLYSAVAITRIGRYRAARLS